jgi:hypothetical protein
MVTEVIVSAVHWAVVTETMFPRTLAPPEIAATTR